MQTQAMHLELENQMSLKEKVMSYYCRLPTKSSLLFKRILKNINWQQIYIERFLFYNIAKTNCYINYYNILKVENGLHILLLILKQK